MTDQPINRPPSKVGDTQSYLGGSSDKILHVTRRGADLLEIRLPDQPGYLGLLIQSGPDDFELRPQTSPGAVAVGGFGLSWADVIDNF